MVPIHSKGCLLQLEFHRIIGRWGLGWVFCGQYRQWLSSSLWLIRGAPLTEPAQELNFGRWIILLWDSDFISDKCSNARYFDLWLILYSTKTKFFSIALITFLYRAGGRPQDGEKRDKRSWNKFDPYHYHLSSLLPPPTTLFPFSLDLPVSSMLSSEHWEWWQNEGDMCARDGSERGYPRLVLDLTH